MHFFEELKRRKVTRVAIGYVVIAWLVLEITSVVAPALRLPEWTITLVLYLLAVGFPVALVLSWMFDITADGLKLDESQSRRKSDHQKPVAVMIALIAISAVLTWYVSENWMNETDNVIAAQGPPSIAVLPFQNFSADPNQEYFVDGLSEEILNHLAKSKNLRVIARTSSFVYRGQNLDMRQIGRDLGVNHLLEGSVRKQGDQIRVTAQLIRVSDGSHIWSESFDHRLGNIFTVQDKISSAISGVINSTLTGGGQTPIMHSSVQNSGAMTDNVEALDLFLRGQYLLNNFTGKSAETDLTDAIQLFEQATQLDPSFANGYASLALAYSHAASFTFGFVDRREALEKAMAAGERAVELSPDSSEAWTALAITSFQTSRSEFRASALEAANRAILLNPNSAQAYATKAHILRVQGMNGWSTFSEAAIKSYELDPLGEDANRRMAQIYIYRGQHEQAKALIQSWSELGFRDEYINSFTSLNAILSGDLAELDSLANTLDAEGVKGSAWVRNRISEAYLTLGMSGKAKTWAEPQSLFNLSYAAGNFQQAFADVSALQEQLGASQIPQQSHLDFLDLHDFYIFMSGPAGELGEFEKEMIDHVEDRMFGSVRFIVPNYRYRPFGLLSVREAWNQNRLGDPANAAHYARRGLQLLDNSSFIGFERSDHDFERARLYAQSGDIQAGLDALQSAVDRGYKSWELAIDPYIEPLRSDARYDQIVARHDAAVAAIRALIDD